MNHKVLFTFESYHKKMQKLYRYMKKFRNKLIALTIVFSSVLFFAFSNDNVFEISKNIDIFVTLFRELNASYVDEIKPEKLIRKGIDGMLESLDPYTEYIAEEEIEDYKRSHLSQEYAGIGALVQTQNGSVVIAEPYFGSPAQQADLMAGDVILKINNLDITNKNVEEITSLLKGPVNTTVKVTVQRLGQKEPLTKTITRQEIKVNNVSYFGIIGNDIGYIKLDKFLDNCSAEVKNAFIQLKEKEKIKSLVLDLRGNGGGILQEAVKIVNLFVPKNTLIVSQKGKIKSNDVEYRASNNPIDAEIPLVVLVDNNSASASEIVAGAIQDTDRGVIIGERTFGKGLVQQTLSTSYNTLLKVTIAKYYTPSGRCIQSLDYTHRKKDGSVVKIADSLITEFKTPNNRSIYDGSGIYPDILVKTPEFHMISFSLLQKNIIFNYATEFRFKNNTIPQAKVFSISDAVYNDFIKYVEKSNFEFTVGSETQLAELEKISKNEKYFANVTTDYEKIRAIIESKKKKDIYTHQSEIKQLLESEICSRYYYQSGRIESSFKYDDDIKEALKVLQNNIEYAAILKGEGGYKTIGKPIKDTTEIIVQKEDSKDEPMGDE